MQLFIYLTNAGNQIRNTQRPLPVLTSLRRGTASRVLAATTRIQNYLNEPENTNLRNITGTQSINYWALRNARLGDDIPLGINLFLIND